MVKGVCKVHKVCKVYKVIDLAGVLIVVVLLSMNLNGENEPYELYKPCEFYKLF